MHAYVCAVVWVLTRPSLHSMHACKPCCYAVGWQAGLKRAWISNVAIDVEVAQMVLSCALKEFRYRDDDARLHAPRP